MDTEQLRALDNEFVWHPFTPMQAYRGEQAPIIVAGDGFDLIDSDGRRYLDGVSSLWCNVHGHRVQHIDRAIRDQLERIAHSTLLGLGNVPSIELARQLVDRTPEGLNKVFYSDTGAAAVEVALKIAFQYHQQKPCGSSNRKLYLCLEDAYHGDTIGSVSVGGIQLFHGVYGDLLFETVRIPAPVAYRTPPEFDRDGYLEHCYDELERAIVEYRDSAAALVIEPLVQGAAGMLVHPPGYLARVRELTSEHGLLLIADEVAVGFGRTGTMFACEQENVTPDLLCLGKGLSGGYLPVAATLATDTVYDAFLGAPTEGRTFYHGHTYTGNPLGCAAALASLELFDQNNVLENVGRNTELLERRLQEIADGPHVGQVRQKGVMVGIELVRDKSAKLPFPPEMRMGHQVMLAARRRGAIVRPLGDVVVAMPAPAMPAELVDTLCDTLFAAIDDVTAK